MGPRPNSRPSHEVNLRTVGEPTKREATGGLVLARNPYVVGVPLTDGTGFFGRKDVFTVIKDVLDAQRQNVVVLYGQRRIGKTSVLHRAAQWLQEQGGFFPVYYDLQGKERLSLAAVLENLGQTLARRLNLPRPDPKLFDDHGRYFEEQLLPDTFRQLGQGRLVLLIDEFDVLSDELASPRAASETLFPYLQGLIQNQPRIGFVFVVGRRIEELATHFQAIFKQAVYRRVGHLSAEESRSLIVEAAGNQVNYEEPAIRQIQALAAGHPYFTQLICFEAFNAAKLNSKTSISAGVVSEVVSRAIESGHGALNWFWEGLPRAERFILSAVAQVSDDSGVGSKEDIRRLLEEHRILLSGLELKDAPDRLVEWEMLRSEGPDKYRFVVELVRRWVLQEHPVSSARRDIDYVSKRAVRLFDNAREAHTAGDLAYARDEYLRTLAANPNHSGAQLGLAQVLHELGDQEAAIVAFERAYEIDQMSARDGLIRARLARASQLEAANNTDHALLDYEAVLKLFAAEPTALRRLSAIWQKRGEDALTARTMTAAAEAFRAALKYANSEEATALLRSTFASHFDSAIEAGEFSRGSEMCELLLMLLPEVPEAKAQAAAYWLRSSEALESAESLTEAEGFAAKAVALFPNDGHAAARLEAIRNRLQERQNIESIYTQALKAHRAGRMQEARDGWKRLIQMDVFSYQGSNIATLLGETVSPSPTGQPTAPEPKSRKRAAKAKREDVPEPTTAPDPWELWRADAGAGAQEQETRVPPRPTTEAPQQPASHSVNPEIESPTPSAAPDTRQASSKRGYGLLTFLGICAISFVVFLLMPARITYIEICCESQVKMGSTLNLNGYPNYDSTWRRHPPHYSDYSWSSGDEKIATVVHGVVSPVAPGYATILVHDYSSRTGGSITITVHDWDVPAMKANAVRMRFLAAANYEAAKAQEIADTKEFPSKGPPLWVQLTLNVDKSVQDGNTTADMSVGLKRASGEIVPVTDWTLRVGDLRGELWWFQELGHLVADSYTIDISHAGKIIVSGSFVVQ